MLRFLALSLLSLPLFLGSSLSLKSQQVYWKTPAGALVEKQTSTLELVFEDCQPEDTPSLPNIDGLIFGTPSSSTQYSMENFQISQRGVLSYPVQPQRQGTVIIPAFQVETSEGPMMVPAITLQVGAASYSSQRNPTLDQIVFSQINANKKTVWLGEIFSLDYLLLLSPNYNAQLAGGLQWSPAGLVLEDWTQPSQVQAQVGGEMRQGIQQVTRACALKSGYFNFPPAEQKINLQTGTQRFGFFSRPKMEQFTVQSQPFSLQVQDLPSPKPTDFLDAVGQFQLDSKIVPRSVAVGEPITWTVELAGTGNWPAGLSLPAREVSSDFRAIEPKSKLQKPDGKPFEGTLTEDVILIPTKPGRYTLGPLNYSYFDPEKSAYVTVTTEPVNIEVKPAPANTFAVTPPTSLEENLEEPSSLTAPSSLLPRDPIELTGKNVTGWIPMTPHFFYFAASPLLAFFACWIGLAFRRSHLTDPQATRKQAKAQLLTLLKKFSSQSHEETKQQLMAWRHHTAQLLSLTHATPTAEEVRERVNLNADPQAAEKWWQLWQATDSFLFSQHHQLPADWSQQALHAVPTIRLPQQPFWHLFLPKNFLPTFFIFFSIFVTSLSAQTNALEAYRQGDFKTAEKHLTQNWNQEPDNWAVRNNLALTLAQQGRWSEATAHWTASRLLNPREQTIAWNLPVGLEKATFTESPQLNFLISPSFLLLASPAEWQWLFFLAIIGLTLGLIFLIFSRYRFVQKQRSFINRWIIYLLLFSSLSLGLLALYGWKRYDILANPNAAVVWRTTQLRSIPTEVDEQASHEIAPGTLVVVHKSFLNWLKIELSNQEIGWIRREALIPFYQAPSRD